MLLGSLAHLMYGSCQSSKWHYIIQCYLIPDYLPEWVQTAKINTINRIVIHKNYTGEWRSWWKNGNQQALYTFTNKVLNGKCYSWRNDGVSLSENNYKNGKINGKTIVWHENGNLRLEYNWIMGKEHGLGSHWYYDGTKESRGNYKDGDKVGTHIKWGEDGKVFSKSFYQKDKLVFEEHFYDEGWLFEKKYYDEHRKMINHEVYLEGEGRIKLFEQRYINGIQSIFTQWNEDSTIKRKEHFDSKGKFQKRELFEKGKLVKTEVEE